MESKTLAIEFQDWRILVSSRSQGGWIFYCLPENQQEALTDDRAYATDSTAVAAAKRFVRQSKARLEIGEWLDSLQEADRISQKEYVWAIGKLAYLMQLCNCD